MREIKTERKLRKSNYGIENSVEAYACSCPILNCFCIFANARNSQANIESIQLQMSRQNNVGW